MGRRRAERPRRRGLRGRRGLVWLAVVAAFVTLAVVAPTLAPDRPRGQDRPSASAPTAPVPSPTVPADVSDLPIARAPFCAQIDDRAVATALQGQVDARTSYRPGDQVTLAPGVTDVAHEFGCTFGAGDARARAWVFAAPVSTREARQLVADARGQDGCRYPEDALGFGTPGVTGICRLGDPAAVQLTSRGLFGESWLTCQLTVPGPAEEVQARAERWCLHVATTLGARP